MSPAAPRQKSMRDVDRVHFVGIGGSGMCGIAEILLGEGYAVSGSDLAANAETERLATLGADVRKGHEAHHVERADVVVASSAIRDDNVEVRRARECGIPVIARARMLAELMRERHAIAVAGTHGKTTTAGLLASIFMAAGCDPSFVIGGGLRQTESNARLGAGRHIIVEADESDASFLHLLPRSALVTNIDEDHLSTYDGDFDALKAAFAAFLDRLPFYGHLVLCADDPHALSLADAAQQTAISYGLSERAQYRGTDLRTDALPWRCTLERPDADPLPLTLPLPGLHNVRNAVGAATMALREGIDEASVAVGLAEFAGLGRRFEWFEGEMDGHAITVVSDYGHHPTELRSVIEATRTVWPSARLVMVYQPHRFTRTKDLFDEFARALAAVDELVLMETYAAGEDPIPGVEVGELAAQMQRSPAAVVVGTISQALDALRELVRGGDVVMVQGAGDVVGVADAIQSSDDEKGRREA